MQNTLNTEHTQKDICKRCHRQLKDPVSKERGFGKTCYKKHLQETPQMKGLFNVETKNSNNEMC